MVLTIEYHRELRGMDRLRSFLKPLLENDIGKKVHEIPGLNDLFLCQAMILGQGLFEVIEGHHDDLED